ncbi:aminoacyl--tRNA ligase-related protein [Enterobacteriaceae endosymbiont of Donacia semicuprea]|uniref:aminoacyl--tRNA ligase-related protein n=1 Tax=Enterobacteriaceae endosymbiont of Donacia semicuprea TaxID=2675783 RepID=UPI001448AB90|nr:aminoacyl--tRNA ligase-related protein [Enterobacteriaceae endosymbiont of Donacia semicuprea]QJC32886.1 proline--tRNA ligase [Enterobacteriaceae endosymbiont of Donacia semicuprea]
MLTTKYLFFTSKNKIHNQNINSYSLMIKAGMIKKLSSGIYIWLPSGLRVIKNFEKIIRFTMNNINAIELLLPMIHPSYLWEKSGRINDYGEELLKILDRKKNSFILGPTHEEVINYLINHEIKSYKSLPIHLYQIQTKFRDEIRSRLGVIRSKEFIMKDSYSFHMNKKCLQQTYEVVLNTYRKIFDLIQINYFVIQANNSVIGGNISHEFHVLSKNGESKIFFFKDNYYFLDKKLKKNSIKIKNSIEIAHIFKIGKKYSESMNIYIHNKKKIKQHLYMGCYGIGISRLIAAVIEQNYDLKGIYWPNSLLAPFLIAIIPINMYNHPMVKKKSFLIYKKFISLGIEVLLDDRKINPGIMFSDIDIIGIPYIIIINNNNIINNNVEYRHRKTGFKDIISLDLITDFIFKKIKLNKCFNIFFPKK